MADGFFELDVKKLKTHEGVAELNRMIRFLFAHVNSNGELPCDLSGYGSPLNVVAAKVGTTYRRLDGGASTSFYVKESGTDASGWVAK